MTRQTHGSDSRCRRYEERRACEVVDGRDVALACQSGRGGVYARFIRTLHNTDVRASTVVRRWRIQ